MVEDLWAIWAASHIDIDIDGETVIVVRPGVDAPGDPLPDAVSPGPIHVVTAWNPRGKPTDDDTNALAQERLVAELSDRQLRHWPARGHAANESWSEDGFAVGGLSRVGACALGRGYDQLAIFELTDATDGLRVIRCDGTVVSCRPAAISVASKR